MKRLVPVVIALLTLSACSKSAPKCSDEKTVKLAKQVYTSHLSDKLNIKKEAIATLEIELRNIRTVGLDKETGRQSCECEMEISVKDKGSTSFPMQFSSELTDSKAHYVSARLTESMFPLPLLMHLVTYNSQAASSKEGCQELISSMKNGKTLIESYFADNQKYPINPTFLEAGLKPPKYIKLTLVVDPNDTRDRDPEKDYVFNGASDKCNKMYVTGSDTPDIDEVTQK